LKPYGSAFVIFRKPAGDRIVAVYRDGQPFEPESTALLEVSEPGAYELKRSSGKTDRTRIAALPPAMSVEGPWQVRFTSPVGAPGPRSMRRLESWTNHADADVKHFSGTASYTREIDIPASMFGPGRRLHLDLGDVREIAEVRLNGKDLGIAWTSPFTMDVTGAARPGSNQLEIRVTNLWANRVIGDAHLPAGRRLTRTNITRLNQDTPLMPSGLLGPVRLRATVAISPH
jgi:hypothetical protein